MAKDANTDAREAGLAIRRQMFGSRGAEDALAAASDFKRPLEELVTDFCFGTIWQREGLDAKTRSMLTVAVLTALGKTGPLKNHVIGALANGVSKEELREIFLHVMVYAGVPTGVEGTLTAEEVLASME